MTALPSPLKSYRTAAAIHREAGTSSEELTVCDFKKSPRIGISTGRCSPTSARRSDSGSTSAGIALVADVFTGEMHAIQGKLYAPDHHVPRSEIHALFTAFGKERLMRWLS